MGFLAPIFLLIGFNAAAAAAISTFIVSFGASVAIGQVSKLFRKRETPGSITQDAGRTITVRQTISPRRVIYGTVRVGGIITFIDLTSSLPFSNNYLHLYITIAGHEVDAITAMYFDGVLVPINIGGEAVGAPFQGFARVIYQLGTRDQEVPSSIIGLTGGVWTSAHRQRGCAGAFFELTYNPTVYPNGIPNITFDVRGKKVYDPRTGQIAYSDNAALCIADYLNETRFTQGLRYESQSQAALFPGDKGFDFVPTIQEVNLAWGSRKVPQT